MTHYAAINQSSRVSAQDFADMCEAINIGFKSYAADLGKAVSTVAVVASAAAAPAGYVLAYLKGPANVPGAGGYHDVDAQGRAYIDTFVDIYLDHGGVVIASTAAEFDNSILGAYSHEHWEADDNAAINQFATINKKKETAKERGDAGEDLGWPVTLASGRVCYISNYLLDAWFNPLNKTGPYDKCKKIKKPFGLSPNGGGYMIMQGLTGGETQFTGDAAASVEDDDFDPSGDGEPCQVHRLPSGLHVVAGSKMPLWKLEHKILHGRIGKHDRKHAGG